MASQAPELGSVERRVDSVQIHLTDDCNLDCLHCYGTKRGSHLDSDQLDHILQEVLRYAHSHSLAPGEAFICGGEPTLSPILFESIRKRRLAAKKARRRGKKITVSELQRAVDDFRLARRLTKARTFRRWLKTLGVSLDEFEEFLETSLLMEK